MVFHDLPSVFLGFLCTETDSVLLSHVGVLSKIRVLGKGKSQKSSKIKQTRAK